MKALKRIRRYFFDVRDCITYTNRVLTFPKVFGIFTYDDEMKICYPYLCSSILSFSIISYAFYMNCDFLYSTPYFWALSRYLDLIELAVTFANSLFCFLAFFPVKKSYVEVVERMYLNEMRLTGLGANLTYNVLSEMLHFIVRFVYILSKSSEYFVLTIDHHHPSKRTILNYILYSVSVDFTYILIHFAMCPFYTVVSVACIQLGQLNRLLHTLRITFDYAGRRKLEELIVIHMELFDACFKLNSIYSVAICAFMLSAFILIIKNIYFLCYTLIALDSTQDAFFLFLSSFNYVVLWFAEASTIAYKCVQVSNQSINFNNDVYKLVLNDKNNFLGKSEKIQIQLTFKPIICFKVCGFLPLDYSLIHGIIAAGTTYIVLLIQFGSDTKTNTGINSTINIST